MGCGPTPINNTYKAPARAYGQPRRGGAGPAPAVFEAVLVVQAAGHDEERPIARLRIRKHALRISALRRRVLGLRRVVRQQGAGHWGVLDPGRLREARWGLKYLVGPGMSDAACRAAAAPR